VTSLLLFDIDGTLVLTGGAGARAMNLAFESVCGVPDAFRGIHMAGRTDAWILTDAAAAHGIASDSPALGRFRDVYLEHLGMELEKPGARKGVMPSLHRSTTLSREDTVRFLKSEPTVNFTELLAAIWIG